MRTEGEDLLVLYEEYLAKLGRSTVTIKGYLSNLKLFHKWHQETYKVKRINFTRIKEIDLLSYRSNLQYEKRHKTATINQHVAALRSFFSFLHGKSIIRESIIVGLRPLSKPYLRAPDVPKRAQILKLFRMVDTRNDRGKRNFAILQLFIQCGGAAFSIILDAACPKDRESAITMHIVARTIDTIANDVGPMCCKSFVRTALGVGYNASKEYFNVHLPIHREKISCFHSNKNHRNCRKNKCLYFPKTASGMLESEMHG